MRAKILVMVTLLLWGVIPILDKKGLSGEKVSPLSGMFIRVLAALAAFALVAAIHGSFVKECRDISWRGWAFFAGSGLVSLVLAQFCYYEALKQHDVGKLFPVLFGGAPVVTAILGMIFLGEKVTLLTGTGLALITLGSVLMFL